MAATGELSPEVQKRNAPRSVIDPGKAKKMSEELEHADAELVRMHNQY